MSQSKPEQIEESDPLAGDDEERSMSLLGGVGNAGGEGGGDGDTVSGASRLLSSGTLLIIVLFGVAVAALYAMRLHQSDLASNTGNKEVEEKIEQAIARMGGRTGGDQAGAATPVAFNRAFADTDSMIRVFTGESNRRQVPIEYIKKNPFLLTLEKPTPAGPVTKVDNGAALHRSLTEEIKGMQLQTVMQGRVPVAIIDGQVLRPGQTVGSFTITAIHGTVVELESRGLHFTLKMSDPNAPKKPGENR